MNYRISRLAHYAIPSVLFTSLLFMACATHAARNSAAESPQETARKVRGILQTGTQPQRLKIAQMLAGLKDHRDVMYPVVIDALKTETDEAVTERLVTAIGNLSRDNQYANQTIPVLKPYLTHADPTVRRAAARMIFVSPSYGEAIIPDLIRCVDTDKDDLTAAACAYSLGRHGKHLDQSMVAILRSLKYRDGGEIGVHVIKAMGPEKTNGPVLKALDHKSEEVVVMALVLVQVNPELAKRAVPKVIRLLDHKDPDVRVWAAKSAGSAGKDAAAALPKLKEMSESDSEEKVRDAATEALSAIGS